MSKTLKITPYKQSRAGFCGPAALRILLSYFHLEKKENELAKICNATSKQGTHPKDLVRVAERLGFRAKSGELGDLKLLDFYINKKKLPVLVDWFSNDRNSNLVKLSKFFFDLKDTGDGHYSVAVGLDKKFIYIADPGLGSFVRIPRKAFQRAWFDFEGDVLKKKKDLHLRWWMVIEK